MNGPLPCFVSLQNRRRIIVGSTGAFKTATSSNISITWHGVHLFTVHSDVQVVEGVKAVQGVAAQVQQGTGSRPVFDGAFFLVTRLK